MVSCHFTTQKKPLPLPELAGLILHTMDVIHTLLCKTMNIEQWKDAMRMFFGCYLVTYSFLASPSSVINFSEPRLNESQPCFQGRW